MRLVLVHGWGFDSRFWVPFCQALFDQWGDLETRATGPRIFVHDFGFFGNPSDVDLQGEGASGDGGPLIAVGHSLGLVWLLKTRPFAWDGLVCVSGFSRFTCDGALGDFPDGVPERIVRRMARQFEKTPKQVLEQFYKNCGLESAPPPGYEPTRLARGLSWLREWDATPALIDEDKPMLALACRQDKIFPFAASQHLFEGRGGTTFVPAPKDEGAPGHALPLLRPSWCARQLVDFAKTI